MSAKRFLFVLVACAFVSIAALAGWRALPHHKAMSDRSYDAIEQIRGWRGNPVDSSYDAIEKMRAKQYGVPRIQSTSHLRDLEQIKDTLGIPDRPISASRQEQLERNKGNLAVTTNPVSASRLEQLERIKDTLGNP